MALRLRDIFSLEVLDTRLAEKRSPKVAPLDTLDPVKEKRNAPPPGPEPSRWLKPEFFIHYAIIGTCIPFMVKAAWDISQPTHPNYHKFAPWLTKGWSGRTIDNSDGQYKSFRNNVPILFSVFTAHFILRRLAGALMPPTVASRVLFDNIFAAIYLIIIHGVGYFKILIILGLNYSILKTLGPSKYTPYFVWIFNIGLLFVNERTRGYMLHRMVDPQYGWIDLKYGGIMPRWEVHFNITMLRIISFSMDYWWMLTGQAGPTLERSGKKPVPTQTHLSDRQRVANPHPEESYSLPNFIAYALYTPLYMAGPILTFNDYLTQISNPPLPSTKTRPVILFGIRFLFALGMMELIQNYLYVVAISKTSPMSWMGDTPFQLAMIGYFNLHIVWLKLLVPWRFFRLWSLADNVDPPENIVRCMSDVFSTTGFWRGWHRSYNRWNIRYIYVPLGGSKRPVMNALIVFTFVALWHDISLNLLVWGWMASVFVVPEFISKTLVPYKVYGGAWWYRHVAAAGGVMNMVMLFVANLVGFCFGWEGVKGIFKSAIWENGFLGGLGFAIACLGPVFCTVCVMFEVRGSEERRGIYLGC